MDVRMLAFMYVCLYVCTYVSKGLQYVSVPMFSLSVLDRKYTFLVNFSQNSKLLKGKLDT